MTDYWFEDQIFEVLGVLCSVIWNGSMDAEETTTDRWEVFELWAYRRMLRISWVDRITNDEVLRRMRKQKQVLNTIKVRKLQYWGHVMRGDRYGLLQVIKQGKIHEQRRIEKDAFPG